MRAYHGISLLILLSVPVSPLIAQSVPGKIPNQLVVGQSGNLEYSVPIPAVPGTAGMEPKLSITYSSQAPTGSLGAGWSISGLSRVSRGPQSRATDGFGAPVRLVPSDALYLDGQRLIPIGRSSSDGQQIVDFRKETDDYSRVTGTLDANSNPIGFTVRTKAGLVLTFGGTPDSNVMVGGSPFVWLCRKISDTVGNYMLFTYSNVGGDYDIESVRYSGHESNPTVAPYAEIRFEYENNFPSLTSYILGTKIQKTRRLKTIRSRLLTPALDVYTLSFEYDAVTTAARFRLKILRYAAGDGTSYEPLRFSYSTAPTAPWFQSRNFDLPIELADDVPSDAFRLVRTEASSPTIGPSLMYASMTGGQLRAAAYINSGTEWKKDNGKAPPLPFSGGPNGAGSAIVADVDGDGLDDILSSTLVQGTVSAQTFVQTPSGWSENTEYRLPVSTDGVSIVPVDVDGDSRLDLLGFDQNGAILTLLNAAPGWKAAVNAKLPAIPVAGPFVVDADCDTRPDLVAAIPSQRGVRLAMLKWSVTGWQTPAADTWNVALADSSSSDVNVLVAEQGGCALVFAASRNRGTGAVSPMTYVGSNTGWIEKSVLNPPANIFWTPSGKPIHARAVDVSGDNLLDLIAREIWQDGTSTDLVFLQLTSPNADNQMWSSANGTGQLGLPFFLARDGVVRQEVQFVKLDADALVDVIDIGRRAPGDIGAYTGNGSTWLSAAAFSPPADFARNPSTDLGIRFIDLNSDGLVDFVYNRTKNSSSGIKCSDGTAELGAFINRGDRWECVDGYIPPLPFPQSPNAAVGVTLLDINNDGFVDLIYSLRELDGTIRQATFLNAFPTNREGWTSSSAEWKTPVIVADEREGQEAAFRFIDVNGDGRVDLIRSYETIAPQTAAQPSDPSKPRAPSITTEYFENTGNGFTARSLALPGGFVRYRETATRPQVGSQFEATGSQLIDLDGDHVPDFIERYVDKVTGQEISMVYRREAEGFVKTGWTSPVLLDETQRNAEVNQYFFDINSDGVADIYRFDGKAASIFTGTGAGWTHETSWDVPGDAVSATYADIATRFVDINGDGLLDIVYHFAVDEKTFSRGVYLNNGAGWTKGAVTLAPPLPFLGVDGSDTGVRLIDVDGNGLPDALKSLKGLDAKDEKEAWLNAGRRSDLLEEVVDSVGIRTALRYQTLAEFRSVVEARGAERIYEHGRAATAYPSISIAPALYVVARMTTDEGGGRQRSTRFRYGDLRADVESGGSQGFAWKETIDENTGVVTRSVFLQDRWLAGKVKHERSTLGAPTGVRVLSEQQNTWTAVSLNGAARPNGGQYIYVQTHLASSSQKSIDLDGTLKGEESTTFGNIDAFGNIHTIVTTRGDKSLLRTENTYDSDPDRAWLGRLTTSTVTKMSPSYQSGTSCVRPACEARRARFTYDPSTLLLASEVTNETSDLYATTTVYVRDAFGNIVSKTTRANSGGVADRQESFEYIGNLGRLLAVSADMAGRVTSEYGTPLSVALGLPTRVVDVNNLVTQRSYDGFGRVVEQIDSSKARMLTRYVRRDQLMPAYASDLAHKNSIRPQPCLKQLLPAWKAPEIDHAIIVQRSAADTNGARISLAPLVKLMDRAGRVIRDISSSFDGRGVRLVFVDREYDDAGLLIGSSEPYFEGGKSHWTIIQHDVTGRPIAAVTPNGACVQVQYSGPTTTSITRASSDGQPRRQVVVTNQRGLPEAVTDANGGVVHYDYDAAGRIIRITGTTRAESRFEYDDGGNRVKTVDQDTGTWTYEYDPFGQLVTQRDPLHPGTPTHIRYDAQGRVFRVTTADQDTIWTFPLSTTACSHGTLASVTRRPINAGVGPTYTETYDYDALCRPNSVKIEIGPAQGAAPLAPLPVSAFVSRQEYDVFGRPLILRYPHSFGTGQFSTVTNYHPETGETVSVDELLPNEAVGRRLWSVTAREASGRLSGETLGAGVKINRTFDEFSGRVRRIHASNQSGAVFDTSYDYDLVGNVVLRADALTTTKTFKYDSLDRLVTVLNESGSVFRSVKYDESGRLTFKSDVGSYLYGSACGALRKGEVHRPFHAPCAIASAGSRKIVERYRYDANGNMNRSPVVNLYFSADNKIVQVSQRSVGGNDDDERETTVSDRFAYGPQGNLFMQQSSEGDGQDARSVTTYKLGLFENEIRLLAGSKVIVDRFYVRTPSGITAFVESTDYRQASEAEAPAALAGTSKDQWIVSGQLFLLVRDNLGSVAVIANAAGKPLQRFAFDPWGRTTLATSPPIDLAGDEVAGRWNRGFIGHSHLLFGASAPALMQMGGRLYDSRLAVFLSPDPILSDPMSSQDLNPFMYVMGNPLKFTDPSGFSWLSDFFENPVKAVANLVENTVREVGRAIHDAGQWIGSNWRTIVVIGVGVAITAYCPPCMANPMIGGFIIGASQGAATAALYGGNSSDILEASLRGGAVGAIGGVASYTAGTYIQSSGVGAASWQGAAAHGVAGGVTSVASGDRFESGFVSGALTQAVTQNTTIAQLEGGSRYAAQAALGGVNAEIGGGKFANGAMYGAFQAMFNDALHPSRSTARQPASDGVVVVDEQVCWGATAGVGMSACGGTSGQPLDVQMSFGWPEILPMQPTAGVVVGYGQSGATLGGQVGFDPCPAGLCGVAVGGEINFGDLWKSNVNFSWKAGPYTHQYKISPNPNLKYIPGALERNVTDWMYRGN